MTKVIGSFLLYVAANFQQLHNEFGRVGDLNLIDYQGLFKEHEEDVKDHEGDANEHE